MKKKLNEALVSYFVEDYNERMNRKYQLISISRECLYQMLSNTKKVAISYMSYCCYGLYHFCWLDEYAEGIWGMSEDEVREMITGVFESHIEEFNSDGRVAFYEDDKGAHVLFLARDLKTHKIDTFIDFWK